MNLLIIVLGLCGFFVARHIRDHKVKQKPLVCMVGFDCHTVVHSDYSKFLGIPVEVLGMFYYLIIAVLYVLFALAPVSFGPFEVYMTYISGTAFLFSLYLIGIQLFVLKKGCSWCIVSSVISALIFILAF